MGFEVVAQFVEHLRIVVERGGQLLQNLVFRPHQVAFILAVLVDMPHLGDIVKLESQSEIFRAEHIMQVGHCREFLGREPAVERVEPLDALVFLLQVGFHEEDVGMQILEQRTGEGPAEHGDAQVGIGLGKAVNDGHHHGGVAQG